MIAQLQTEANTSRIITDLPIMSEDNISEMTDKSVPLLEVVNICSVLSESDMNYSLNYFAKPM